MSAEPSPEQIERANELKEEANELVKAEKFQEALRKYTEALHLNQDPIYYCNRAAVYCRLEEYDHAIQDCRSALALQPNYAKAYSRMGLALSCQNLHKQAVKMYKKALDLAPNNAVYKQHLEIAESKLREAEGIPDNNPQEDPLRNLPFNVTNIMNNPEIMQMTTQMMADPNVQDMVSQMLTNLMGSGSGQSVDQGTFENFIRTGEAMAERLNQSNPELFQQFRNMNLNEATRDAPSNGDQDTEPTNMTEFLRASDEMAKRLQESNPELVEQLRSQFEERASAFTNADGSFGPESIPELLRAGQAMAERLRGDNPELVEQMRRAFEEGVDCADDDENPGCSGKNDRQQENRKDRNAPGGK